jgi:acetyl esterase/lipase
MLLLVTLVPLLIVVGVLGAAALDGGDDGSPRAAPRPLSRGYAPAGTERIDIGRGARGAAVFRRRASAWDGPVVLFLHGWAAGGPRAYGAWIGHLTRNGATVIYPTYQVAPFVDTVSPLPNLLAAIAEVVGDVPALRRPLVVVGHSAGGRSPPTTRPRRVRPGCPRQLRCSASTPAAPCAESRCGSPP